MRRRKWWLAGLAVLVVMLILTAVLAEQGASPKQALQDSASTAAAPASGITRAEFKDGVFNKVGSASDTAYQVKKLTGDAVGVQDRKVIKNAELSLQVKELLATMQKIEARVEALNGLIVDSSVHKAAKGEDSAQMTLRVPSEGFGNLLPELEALGKVLRRRVYSQDVTKDYLDLEARISNLTRQEERLRQILAQANTVEDILKVEKELERVRGQIETNTGELNFLQDRVRYSTINLNLQAQSTAAVNLETGRLNGVLGRSVAAFMTSVNGVLSFGSNLVVFVIGFIPVAVVLAIVAVLARPVRRRYLARQQDRSSSSGPTD